MFAAPLPPTAGSDVSPVFVVVGGGPGGTARVVPIAAAALGAAPTVATLRVAVARRFLARPCDVHLQPAKGAAVGQTAEGDGECDEGAPPDDAPLDAAGCGPGAVVVARFAPVAFAAAPAVAAAQRAVFGICGGTRAAASGDSDVGGGGVECGCGACAFLRARAESLAQGGRFLAAWARYWAGLACVLEPAVARARAEAAAGGVRGGGGAPRPGSPVALPLPALLASKGLALRCSAQTLEAARLLLRHGVRAPSVCTATRCGSSGGDDDG